MNVDDETILEKQQHDSTSKETDSGSVTDIDSPSVRYAGSRFDYILANEGSLLTRIANVKVFGSPNTRHQFLRRIFDPLVNAEPGTLKKTLDELTRATDRLTQFGVYDSIAVTLDENYAHTSDSLDLEAIIVLKERSRLWLRTGTDFGNQEGNAYASANLRNIFGGAESLEGNLAFGTRTKTSYELKFTSPILADPNKVLEVIGYGTSRLNSYASHHENTRGVMAKLRQYRNSFYNEFALQIAERQITNIQTGASLFIRSMAGMSRKTSLSHTISRDTTDGSAMPMRGYKIKSTQEVAIDGLLESSAAFTKFELEGAHHTPLTRDETSVFNASFKSGIMFNRNSSGVSYLSDKFQLGGPQSVRGFMFNGLGPRSGRDSLGGELYLATGWSVLTPIPGVPDHWPVRLHSFLNTGALLELGKANKLATLKELISRQSISAGIGLAFKHPVARVEMNFCLPIVCRGTDRSRKGLQFGLGIDFM